MVQNTKTTLSGKGRYAAVTGSVLRSNEPAPYRCKGTDFLRYVYIPPNVQNGPVSDSVLVDFPITPETLVGTRIQQLSQLYERYRFTRFDVVWQPAIPATLGAQLVGYIDTDPKDNVDTLTDHQSLITQATAQSGAVQFNANETARICMSKSVTRLPNMLYTGTSTGNERFSQQGRFVLVLADDLLESEAFTYLAGKNPIGTLNIDWEIELATPQVNPTSLSTIQSTQATLFDLSGYKINNLGVAQLVGYLNVTDPGVPLLSGIRIRTNVDQDAGMIAVQNANGHSTFGQAPAVVHYQAKWYGELVAGNPPQNTAYFNILKANSVAPLTQIEVVSDNNKGGYGVWVYAEHTGSEADVHVVFQEGSVLTMQWLAAPGCAPPTFTVGGQVIPPDDAE